MLQVSAQFLAQHSEVLSFDRSDTLQHRCFGGALVRRHAAIAGARRGEGVAEAAAEAPHKRRTRLVPERPRGGSMTMTHQTGKLSTMWATNTSWSRLSESHETTWCIAFGCCSALRESPTVLRACEAESRQVRPVSGGVPRNGSSARTPRSHAESGPFCASPRCRSPRTPPIATFCHNGGKPN